MNELFENKSWIKQNRKWFLPISLFCLVVVIAFFSSGLGNNVVDISKAYSETLVYENALLEVKDNKRVKELLGGIEPIDNMAILEGAVEYSNNNSTINSSIRVKGSKGKGKMDIEADKINGKWKYKTIHVRVKKPKQTIEIINTNNRMQNTDN